jgi:hypothetical protein
MLPGRMTKSRADRQPILSLVDREFLKSTANTPRGMWEPMSYLYSEADKSLERIAAMEIPQELQEVADAAVKQWHQAIAWLDELLIQSGSVDALRSWQLMTGLQSQGPQQGKPSAAIMPDFPQPTPPGQEPQRRSPRGLRLR